MRGCYAKCERINKYNNAANTILYVKALMRKSKWRLCHSSEHGTGQKQYHTNTHHFMMSIKQIIYEQDLYMHYVAGIMILPSSQEGFSGHKAELFVPTNLFLVSHFFLLM